MVFEGENRCNDQNLQSLTFIRTDSTVNFDWKQGSPDTDKVGNDFFSVRWSGYVVPKYSEEYTFTTTSDDGVRLSVNGQQLINQWIPQSATPHEGKIRLEAGKAYAIKLEYFEEAGGSVAKLEWNSNSQTKEIIPEGQLFVNDPTKSLVDNPSDNNWGLANVKVGNYIENPAPQIGYIEVKLDKPFVLKVCT